MENLNELTDLLEKQHLANTALSQVAYMHIDRLLLRTNLDMAERQFTDIQRMIGIERLDALVSNFKYSLIHEINIHKNEIDNELAKYSVTKTEILS